jgi:ribosomal protein L11 methyltransferase
MNYIELNIIYESKLDFFADLLIAELGEIGYDSFLQEENEIKAYIKIDDFSLDKIEKLSIINENKLGNIKYDYTEIEYVNWNEKWEQNFSPVIINDDCIIKAPFHNIEKKYNYEIIIEPKMSFGTGHHSTTALVIEMLLETDCKNKTVVDCGCGTGILAIFTALKGAKKIKAFDIDQWCIENTNDNISLNNISNNIINVELGGFENIKKEEQFDIVIANINRNILINSMQQISDCLKINGTLLLSGFYESDINHIQKSALENNLKFVTFKEKNNWASCCFTK